VGAAVAAYVVVEVTITDEEAYEKYKPMAYASIVAHGGRYLVRGGAVDSVEGDAVEARIVVLEFPDMEAARRWYRSDDYQAALSLREGAARSRLFMVEGAGGDVVG
jgi:uncharacterized protein (DUF1330 family)